MNDCQEQLKNLIDRVAKMNGMKAKDLSGNISFYPAEKTWGVSVSLFFIENDQYTTSSEFLVEMIDDSLDLCFFKINEELDKLVSSSSN